jgi:hypothetical protein
MHTVELLDHALEVARQLGFRIRHEWLGGSGGGGCLIKGEKWLFLDLALTPFEQLALVADTVRGDPGLTQIEMTSSLQTYLEVRRSA